MELRVLRYFQTVVQQRNISQAAAKLHVSQPTISRQLRDLETELGTTLLERGSRAITLTESGEYFYHQVEQILALADKTVDNLYNQNDIQGSFVIGAAEAKSFLNVAHALAHVQRDYPKIQAKIFSTNADEVRTNLKSGVFDFGVVMEPAIKTDYDFIHLPGESRWGLLVTNRSPLAQQDHVTLADLQQQKLIISHQSGMQDLLQDWFGDSFSQIQVVATYNLLYNASLLVSAGVGAALCLDGIVNTNQSDLVFIPLKPRHTAGSSLVWLKHQHLSTAAETFLKQLKSDLTM